MPFDLDAIARALTAQFPVEGLRCRLVLGDPFAPAADGPPARVGPSGDLVATLALLTFEERGAEVREVKVQEVALAPAARAEDVRVVAYLAAWSRALPGLLTRAEVERTMPYDHVPFEALDEPVRTEEEFASLFASPAWVEGWAAARARRDLVEMCASYGVERFAERLLSLHLHPEIRIRTIGESLGDMPLGGTRLGGLPDLPSDVSWPNVNGEPLDFLGQFDLAAIVAAGLEPSGLLPRSGTLSFFAPLVSSGLTDGVATLGGGAVLHFDTPHLRRSSHPVGPLPERVLPLRAVELEARHGPPPIDAPVYPAILAAAGERADFENVLAVFHDFVADQRWAGDADEPRQHLLGHATSLRGSPYLECEAQAAGRRQPSPELEQAAARWQLLLQLDSEHDKGVIYGDGGRLYFFIQPEDLAARRFERACFVMQPK